jgi:hypothetical protein
LAVADSFSGALVASFTDNLDMMIDEVDLVAGADFFTLAGFDFAVDAHQALLDDLLGIAAAFRQPLGFEDLI